MKSIFVVEDDIEIANLLNILLKKEGYEPKIFHRGNDFLNKIYDNEPDLIILDILLPDISGLELCKELKKEDKFKKTPVIALTSRSDKFDVVIGLNVGFDDYMTKPFDNAILMAKINAILRKENNSKNESYVMSIDKDFILDKNSYSIIITGETIKLTSLEFKTLCLLVENSNIVINRNKIIDVIKGNDIDSSDRSIDKLINRIRKKLGNYSKNLVSVYGVGYCFKSELKLLN